MIFAFLGRKCSGKDTSAEILKNILDEHGITYHELAFADSIKKTLAAMFNVPEELFHDQLKKETKCILEKYSPRELLCWYGDMMKERFGDDFFVTATKKVIEEKLKTVDVIIVTDLRFSTEAYYLIGAGATFVYLNRDKVLGPMPPNSHLSETSVYASVGILKSFGNQVNFIEIDNNGTLEKLADNIRYLYAVIRSHT